MEATKLIWSQVQTPLVLLGGLKLSVLTRFLRDEKHNIFYLFV
jgi:hypothetical protein